MENPRRDCVQWRGTTDHACNETSSVKCNCPNGDGDGQEEIVPLSYSTSTVLLWCDNVSTDRTLGPDAVRAVVFFIFN